MAIDAAARSAFAERVQALAPLDGLALKAVMDLLQPRRVEASSWLLQAGQPAVHVYFVVEGLVRELYIDADGQEHTRAFASAGHFTGSLMDLLSGAPALTWVQALEPSLLLAADFAALDALAQMHPTIDHLLRRAAEQLYLRKARREYELLALPAAQRHALWLQQQGGPGGLASRISQRMLASYLGITPEHLSRLRRSNPGSGPGSGPEPAAD